MVPAVQALVDLWGRSEQVGREGANLPELAQEAAQAKAHEDVATQGWLDRHRKFEAGHQFGLPRQYWQWQA